MSSPDAESLASVRRERDLYLRLLNLSSATSILPFLEETLALLVEVTSAEHGYVELQDSADPQASWSAVHRLSPASLHDVKTSISHGIIARTLAIGETVVTASAVRDDRFHGFPSVQRGIEAVLCIPIGAGAPCGVVYLQGPREGGAFSDADRACAEMVSRHLEPIAGRLLASHRATMDDPTAPYREGLQLDGFIGRSPAIVDVLRDVAMVVRSNRTLLLTGETGTGKSQLARMVHASGPRAARPFTDINLAAIHPGTVESELFGHVKGAFTGADRDRVGLLGESEGGTVFLDEIGDAPMEVQRKLLQFLQSGEYRPISGALRRADVRVIAGTRVDLDRAVAEGRFRDDLLYRLNVITIRMPSLRERRGDIRDLAMAFCDEACRTEGGARLSLSPALLAALEGAEWGGNVRQLQNAVVRGVMRAIADHAPQVEHRHVFHARNPPGDPGGPTTYHAALQQAKKRLVRDALEASGWNVAEAARSLEISRAHIYNLMQECGLQRLDGDDSKD